MSGKVRPTWARNAYHALISCSISAPQLRSLPLSCLPRPSLLLKPSSCQSSGADPPSSSSPPPPASEGNSLGNHPYRARSTRISPISLAVTWMPSARRASAWFWAPPGWLALARSAKALITVADRPARSVLTSSENRSTRRKDSPRRYRSFRIDDPLPRNCLAAELGLRVRGEMLEADAHLPRSVR